MKRFIIITLILLFLVTLPLLSQSSMPPMLPDGPPKAPIDGGLIWLILGGGAYGIKKLRERS